MATGRAPLGGAKRLGRGARRDGSAGGGRRQKRRVQLLVAELVQRRPRRIVGLLAAVAVLAMLGVAPGTVGARTGIDGIELQAPCFVGLTLQEQRELPVSGERGFLRRLHTYSVRDFGLGDCGFWITLCDFRIEIDSNISASRK
jgi:hypothetical protein